MKDVIKSILYRLYNSFVISPLIIYFLTGNIVFGFAYGSTEFAVKIFTYYVYEKVWKHFCKEGKK